MKANRIIVKTLALASISLITATTSFAHSSQDDSTVPCKWQSSEKLSPKISTNLNPTKANAGIELNPFEQKNVNDYGAKVVNNFSSIVRNIDVIFKKTSTGIKVVDASIFNTDANENFVPLVKDSNISKFSMKKTFNIEDGHKHLNIKWSFGEKTNSKIVKHLFKSKQKLSIGLTQLEQNLLTEYGIECGNKFELSIFDNRFLVKKTSKGLIILNHIENIGVVKAGYIKNKVKVKVKVNDNI